MRSGSERRVFGHVLARLPVPASYRLPEHAASVERRHRQAIHLQLGHVTIGGVAEQLTHPPVEIPQLAFVQSVVQAEHRRAMADLHESFARLTAHSLGGGIGRHQLRMPVFQLAQPVHQLVVLGVADLGGVQNVVQVLVAPQRLAQLGDLRFCFFTHPLLIIECYRHVSKHPPDL